MKIASTFALLFCTSISFAANNFKVMSWCDPIIAYPDRFSEQSGVLDRLDSAGFNVLSGNVCLDKITGVWPPAHPYTLDSFYSIRYNDSIIRILNRWNAKRGKNIKRFIYSTSIKVEAYTGTKFYTRPHVDSVLNYFGNSYLGPKTTIAGYNVGDEPETKDSAIQIIDSVVTRINTLSPNSYVYLNLFPSYAYDWNGSYTGAQIDSKWSGWYVPNTTRRKVSSIGDDYYQYSNVANAGGTAAYRNTWYKDYWLLATLAQKKGVPFFPVLLATSHGGYPKPLPSQLRLSTTVALAYSAKSIAWYTYRALVGDGTAADPGYPDAIESPTSSVRATVSTINKQLQIVGDSLTSLTWIETIHGSVTDPNTGENISPNFDPNSVTSNNKSDLIAGVFKSPSGDVVMIVGNKNLSAAKVFSFALAGDFQISELSKSTGKYSSIVRSTSGQTNNITTKFSTSSILPGDYSIIKLTGKVSLPISQKNTILMNLY